MECFALCCNELNSAPSPLHPLPWEGMSTGNLRMLAGWTRRSEAEASALYPPASHLAYKLAEIEPYPWFGPWTRYDGTAVKAEGKKPDEYWWPRICTHLTVEGPVCLRHHWCQFLACGRCCLNTVWMNNWKYQTWFFFSPITSIGGVPMVKLAAYGSSKAALTMFSAVMRQELSKWGVKVSVIQPGGFRTSGYLSWRVLQCSSWKRC